MKKKIYLFLVMALLIVCVFCVCANASNYDKSASVTLDGKTGSFNLYDEDGDALIWYYGSDGAIICAKTKEAVTVTNNEMKLNGISLGKVAILNLQDDSFKAYSEATLKLNMKFEKSESLEYVYFADEIKGFLSNYNFARCPKLKVAEFTEESMAKELPQYGFHQATALVSFYIPSEVEDFPYSNNASVGVFSECTSLKTVVFGGNDKIKNITPGAFYKTSSLETAVLPDSVTYVAGGAFRYSGIINSPFSENSRLTTLGQYSFRDCDRLNNLIIPSTLTTIEAPNYPDYGPFAECLEIERVTFGKVGTMTVIPDYLFSRSNIKSIEIPDGITHIGIRAFYRCTSLEEVRLPNTVLTAGQRAFEASGVKKIYFGANFRYVQNTVNDNCSLTNSCDNLAEVYIPYTFYSTALETPTHHGYVFAGGSNLKYFYTGTAEQAIQMIANFKASATNSRDNSKFLNAKHISYADYILDTEKYANGNYIVYGYNQCEAFYDGAHKEDNNTCMVNCDRCNTYGVAEKNPVHNNSEIIRYVSFDKVGERIVGCVNEGCTCNEKTDAPALFTFCGYSVSENGLGGFAIGYIIDNEAIDEYEKVNKEQLEYGVFVAVKNMLGENDIFDEKAQGVFNLLVSNYEFVLLELKLVGFSTVEQKKAELAIGAYVVSSDKISYLQGEAPLENEKYHFVSYNDILLVAENK